MPVAATGLADVGARNPHPLVLGGSVEHPLEQLAIAGLQITALGQGGASPGDPLRQRIPHPLELFQSSHPRRGEATGDLRVNAEPRKSLSAQTRQLMLQPPDLTSKLRARKPLAASNPKRGERLVFKQVRHRTRVECRSPAPGRKRRPR